MDIIVRAFVIHSSCFDSKDILSDALILRRLRSGGCPYVLLWDEEHAAAHSNHHHELSASLQTQGSVQRTQEASKSDKNTFSSGNDVAEALHRKGCGLEGQPLLLFCRDGEEHSVLHGIAACLQQPPNQVALLAATPALRQREQLAAAASSSGLQTWAVGSCPAGVMQLEEGWVVVPDLESLFNVYARQARLHFDGTGDSLVVIGYNMKASREMELGSRQLLPLVPVPHGCCYIPLPVLPGPDNLMLGTVVPDAVLHKATDDLVEVPGSSEWQSGLPLVFPRESALPPLNMRFSPQTLQLQQLADQVPSVSLVDELFNVRKVMDRGYLGQMMAELDLKSGHAERAYRLRGPTTAVLFGDGLDLQAVLDRAGLRPPYVIKPLLACGPSASHDMVLVSSEVAAKEVVNKSIPLPAVAQQFINHGGRQLKVYVIGKEVMWMEKASIPDVHPVPGTLVEESGTSGPGWLSFNSLKSLPGVSAGSKEASRSPEWDEELVHDAAELLGADLQLKLFGFDLVVERGSNDHYVVDVNAFPSFKGVAGAAAALARLMHALRRGPGPVGSALGSSIRAPCDLDGRGQTRAADQSLSQQMRESGLRKRFRFELEQ